MRIAKGIEVLELQANPLGRPSTVYPTLAWDDANVILVDAGYPGQVEQIGAAIEKAGVPFDRLNRIIITHHDIDHIGGLAGLLKALPDQITTMAYEDEKDYIDGHKRPLKLAQLEANLESLPTERKGIYESLKAGFANSQVEIDQALTDGEELPYCGGMTVIYTPGHTLGHICLFLKESRTLIAGDALRVEDGKLAYTPASANHDERLYHQSLKKLTPFDIDTVICYHGGIINEDASQQIAALAQEHPA